MITECNDCYNLIGVHCGGTPPAYFYCQYGKEIKPNNLQIFTPGKCEYKKTKKQYIEKFDTPLPWPLVKGGENEK